MIQVLDLENVKQMLVLNMFCQAVRHRRQCVLPVVSKRDLFWGRKWVSLKTVMNKGGVRMMSANYHSLPL